MSKEQYPCDRCGQVTQPMRGQEDDNRWDVNDRDNIHRRVCERCLCDMFGYTFGLLPEYWEEGQEHPQEQY